MKSKLLSSTAAVGKVLAERVTIKLGAFSSVMAVLTWATLSPLVFPPETVHMETPNYMVFRTDFNGDSVSQAIKHLEAANKTVTSGERVLITLDSPGGSVFDGMTLFEEMAHSKVPVDVYVPAFAASMGANLLMRADKRYVAPEATVLFHGAHAGSYQVSEVVLKDKLDILESDTFKEYLRTGTLDPSIKGAVVAEYAKLYQAVMDSSYSGVYIELKSVHSILKSINDSMVNYIAGRIGKSFEETRRVLFNDMKSDMVFTGKQLLEMGIIHSTERPDPSQYKG